MTLQFNSFLCVFERLHIIDHEAMKVEILELQKLVEGDCHAEKEVVNLKIKVKNFFAISFRL